MHEKERTRTVHSLEISKRTSGPQNDELRCRSLVEEMPDGAMSDESISDETTRRLFKV
jgi:hypothetical protein